MPQLTDSWRREELVRIVHASSWFMSALHAVNSLNLRSWCIGAGAIRNLVWDHLHGYEKPSEISDIDVAYFDPRTSEQGREAELQERLRIIDPKVPWEVTNQAFVHTWFESYFGHPVPPLGSIVEAVASWPEYATAVGVFLTQQGRIAVISPHGLEDLFALRVRRNPVRVSIATYRQRVEQKQYSKRWPRVSVDLS